MPWQCSYKKLCFFAPIIPKIVLAQSAKAYIEQVAKISLYTDTTTEDANITYT